MKDAVIVSTARTPIGKAYRGAFNDTEAPVLGGHVIRAALNKVGVAGEDVGDVILGIAAQQGTQGYNLGRLCGYTAGLPESVGGMVIDRMCASGLMSIATASKSIMTGELDIAVAGGLESISLVQNKYKNSYRAQSKAVLAAEPTAYIQMIETAELVSQRYGTAGALAGWGGRILLVDIRNGSMRLRAGSGALMQLIRMPSTRREPSRTTAKASGRISSSVSPFARRSRNLFVYPVSLSSVSACICGSSALIFSTTLR